MGITDLFVAGFLVSFIGVLPPGLLNMSAAKISLKEGHSRGIMFSIGACIVVLAQTYIAVALSRYLSKHPDVVAILQRVAFVIFVLITIYFLFIAKEKVKPDSGIEMRSKRSRFFQGILLSILNMFAIPYQAFVTITLASFGWMLFDNMSIWSYVLGSGMGSFAMFYIYMFFFDKIKSKAITSQKSMNYLIGGITGFISVITLVNIIKNW